VTNLGYIGHGWQFANQPSCEYPLNSNVEHLYLGGLWVGAEDPDGVIRVSTGARDGQVTGYADLTEFQPPEDGAVAEVWSNSQNSDLFDPRALATQHIQMNFDDYKVDESGNHVPLGIRVDLRALAWSTPFADDFVILDYGIINVSQAELRNLYVGLWLDTTVGNTENTDPYDPNAPQGWNYYDDCNGAWGAEGWVGGDYQVQDDPGIWMCYEHDDDGEMGLATSWVGTRLLGTRPAVPADGQLPPVSYNAWTYQGVPVEDDWYDSDNDDIVDSPGKYQFMANGEFDVGEGFDYCANWIALLSTGPIAYLAPGDTLHATFAVVCGADSLGLLANSKVAQLAYDDGFRIPQGPPSPRLEVGYEWNSIELAWAPGDSLDRETGEPLPDDDPRRSPEHHISQVTGKPDFQGYRIYRYQGLVIDQDPFALATLVAEFDKIDGFGFDTGLPPVNEDGLREFTDTGLLDGFPYWYAVTSFSAPDPAEGLPSFESGFNENAELVYPGPAATSTPEAGKVGVAPNPYRGGSLFDKPGGERELGRRVWFTNLPARCTIKIFTLAGDLVRTLHHDDPYEGKQAWDLLSEHQRAIASGLYVYVVEDADTGEVQRGKLVVIK